MGRGEVVLGCPPGQAENLEAELPDQKVDIGAQIPRAQSGLIRRDREIMIFGYFSFFMHARNISNRDIQTIHLENHNS